MEIQIYLFIFDPENSLSPYAFTLYVHFTRHFSKSFVKLIQ